MSQISIIDSSISNFSDVEHNDQQLSESLQPRFKKDDQKTLFSLTVKHLTTVAHVCIGIVTIYMVYLSCLKFEFFNWHPILYSIGWLLLMTEAVFMLTKENVFATRSTYTWRVRWHWLLQVVAVACSIAGFFVVFAYEHGENNVHYRTAHGIAGLVAMIFAAIPTCLSGLTALFNVKLRTIVAPKVNKMIHATSGILSLIVGAVAMVLSLYTGWFNWKIGNNQDIFVICHVALVFGLLWVLFRPMITFLERLKSFCH